MRLALFAGVVGPALLLLAAAPGCNKNDAAPGLGRLEDPIKLPPPKPPEKRTVLEIKARDGIVEGRVLYDGEPPPLEPIPKMLQHPDHADCLKGDLAETSRQAWFVNKENKGVANVVVWLEPPSGKYFSLTEAETNRSGEEVLIDQPHCAFVPHVATLFPSYFNGEKHVHTGQKLVIRNRAPFPHSVQWDPSLQNAMNQQALAPNSKYECVLAPQPKPLPIGCGLHSWMNGFLYIFEHPYHAVTRADGSFQLENVPTDVELTFKAWHESQTKSFEQRKVTLKKGQNPPIELKIKQS